MIYLNYFMTHLTPDNLRIRKSINRFSIVMMRFLVFALLLNTRSVFAQDNDLPIFKFNGFGTLGVVHSSEDQADFIIAGIKDNGAGYSRSWALGVDSLLAGQISANITPKLSAVVQAMVEQNYDGSYRPHIEWANLQYQFSPDLSIRIGRISLATFLVSSYRKLGYANPWVRPPIELYSLAPIATNNGVDINYQFRVGELTNTIQSVYGGNEVNVSKNNGGGKVKSEDAFGLSYTGEYRATTVHLSYHTTTLNVGALQKLYDGFRQFGEEGIALAARYDPNDKSYTFLGFGGTYDPGKWFLTGEWGNSTSSSQIGRRSAWYISTGHRFGLFTPYLTYSKRKFHSTTFEQGLTLASLPPSLVATASQLNNGLNAALSSQQMQQTVSVGTRWDLIKNAAIKLQFDHSEIGNGSVGSLINIQPKFERGGKFNLLSATIDFVF